MLRRTFVPAALLGLAVALFVLPSYASAQCATLQSQDRQNHPVYSGTLPNLLSTAGNDKYLYEATQYGFARASLANPASPGQLQLLQIGQKYVPGDNGGLIYLGCDCYQGASTMEAAEAPDGTSRMVSDFRPVYGGILRGMLGLTIGPNGPQFGNQLNIAEVALGSTVAAVYMPSTGKFFGYFPSSGVQVVDLTNPSGTVAASAALNPSGSFNWTGVGILKSGSVSIGGIQHVVLVGFVGSQLRVAEPDPSTGALTEKASTVAAGAPNSLYAANVNGRAYIFSADNSAGLNVYEYTGNALNFAGNLPGYFNQVVVKGTAGSPYPAIFLHRSIRSAQFPGDPQDGVDIWDSKWLSGGAPVRAATLGHQGTTPPTGRGNAIEAVVTGGGSQIIAHVYRLASTTNPQTNPEHLLITDNVDISCIAADTTSPPRTAATFTNVSAALRSGAERTVNYYGDRVTLSDNSSTGVPITRVDWDLNNPGSGFAPDISGTATSLPNIFFPCDPAAGGNQATGADCAASLGLSSNPGPQSFIFAEQSANQNGTSPTPFYTAPLPFVMPSIGISGFSAGVLRVLTGGSADATPTTGNTADATFQWSFSGGAGGAPTGITVPVPAGATGFSLTVTWRGGYSKSVTGTVVQTDLVPAFTILPNGTLGTGFLLPGTASIAVPATEGSYCVTLRYNYTPAGQSPTNQTVSSPLTVIIQTTPLSASVGGPASGTVGTAMTFTATPAGGTGTGYTFAWDCNYSQFSGGNFAAGTNTTSCTYNQNGSYTPAVRVTDSASNVATAFGFVTVTGGPTGGGGNLAATIFGATTGSTGSPITFSATATGGSGSYSYAWACDYTILGGSGQFSPGSNQTSCTFNSNGTKNVAVRVSDGTNQLIVQYAVTIGGGGGPGPNGLSVSIAGPTTGSGGATLTYTATATGGTAPYGYAWACDYGSTYTVGLNQPVTFSAAETAANASVYGWTFGDGTIAAGSSSRTVTKTYSSKGTYQAVLDVTGNGTTTAGTNTSRFTIQVVTPAPSGQFTLAGAQGNSDGTVFTATAGEQITMTAAENNALSWGWIFGDDTSGAAQSVKKTYSKPGSYIAKLLVTGNERETTGLTISTFTINVVSCAPNAATLCLNDNRFKATVEWSVPPQQKTGSGAGVSLTGDTGYYWFFSPSNIELVLKVVDGRTFNGKFWVFYGALSNVEYTITVKDTKTGAVKTYHNAYGTTASLADVNAFDGGAAASTEGKHAQAVSAISVSCTPSPVGVGQQVTCTASPDGTYSWLWGDETKFPSPYAPGPNPNSHTYTSAGPKQVTVTTDNGITIGSVGLAVVATVPGGLAAVITGPATGSAASALSFTGSATGGTGPYTYAWACDYNAASPTFTTGTAQNVCTFATAGSHVVGLRVTDSATPAGTAITTSTVSVSPPAGPGLPSALYTVGGARLNSSSGKYEAELGAEITFTANEANASKWAWNFGDGSAGKEGQSVNYTYLQRGNYDAQLIVTGDGTKTVGLSMGTIPVSVLPCAGDSKTLCLNGGRFKVRVDWKSESGEGFGTAVPVTGDTGEFWFLSANNIELVLKVVDGTSFNGHFWVFYGALSDLEYTITVTDTTTGTVKTYHNPLHTTASVADVNAF
ncbi:MAG: PKD domain-containing protein [Acidobacteria bacterium]|nr:PKD domain-containing protein [Acidobacteriota bacterium]